MRAHAFEPGADGRIAPEVEAALVRDVGVGVEGDVGDGAALGDEVGAGNISPRRHGEIP